MLMEYVDLKAVSASIRVSLGWQVGSGGSHDTIVCPERKKQLSPLCRCQFYRICENKYLVLDSKYSQGMASIQLEQGGGGNFSKKKKKKRP